MMSLGLVYFVFLPSMVTTPLAGPIARKYGARLTGAAAMILAALGLPLLLLPTLSAVLLGLVLVSVGTFFAQAVATGFVGRAARADRAAASGMYLSELLLRRSRWQRDAGTGIRSPRLDRLCRRHKPFGPCNPRACKMIAHRGLTVWRIISARLALRFIVLTRSDVRF